MVFFRRDTRVYLEIGGSTIHIPTVSNISASSTYSADEVERATMENPFLLPDVKTTSISTGNWELSFYLGSNGTSILEPLFSAMLPVTSTGSNAAGSSKVLLFPDLETGTGTVSTRESETFKIHIVNGTKTLTLHTCVLTTMDIPLSKELLQLNLSGEFAYQEEVTSTLTARNNWTAFAPIPLIGTVTGSTLGSACTGGFTTGNITFLREVSWLERKSLETVLAGTLYTQTIAVSQGLKLNGSLSYYSGTLDIAKETDELLTLQAGTNLKFVVPRAFFTERLEVSQEIYTTTVDFRANYGESPEIHYTYY